MSAQSRILLCNCFKTMDLTGAAGLVDSELAAPVCTELCRGETSVFETALAQDGDLLVACTQEAPLFSEIAEDHDAQDRVRFTNIRETAGWTSDKTGASAKIAALLSDALAADTARPAPALSVDSDGVCLVYGAGQAALDAALKLEDSLSVTLVMSAWDDVLLPAVLPFPVYCGRLKTVSGSFGGFEVVLNGYAPMLPSSRQTPEFMLAKDGARAPCSVIVDLSGETAPITAPKRRDGYFRADPNDRLGVMNALTEAAEMVGTFEKPVYVFYDADICAHSHAGKTGCSKCLDACPAGAIQSAGEKVAIDAGICGGCGSCAITCPTGAISYQYPHRDDALKRIQKLLEVYTGSGGTAPVLLIHEQTHGTSLINALSRYGGGLPANVLPLGLHASTTLGHEAFLTAFLSGAHKVVVLASPENREELLPSETEAGLARALLSGMGHAAEGRIDILVTGDPDMLAATLAAPPATPVLKAPQKYSPVGGKRDIARLAITALHTASPEAPALIPLPDSAQYGRISIDSDGCTLCLACVSACPAGALADNPDRPQVSFVESACVQCGLCQTTCPEKVISLEPRFNAAPDAMRPAVLHEEEPATCISCGKAFGTRSTIDRIKGQLAGKHHMFRSETQISMIEMCDDCRISAQWNMDKSVFSAGERPKIRMTEDYVADKALSVDDFLKDT
ncbi:4Fe-4S binding protein [Roseibium hamelinense]|uniref:4Fe-4S binding protein n=1 Tax=Roseibium hamelinense TaxID=150831 RepID=A0A562T8I8_9HYPH|nr:4Fe-4S dicluster domain-containing protein [Roseibium hamelinense]MTI42354.1 4Fe-4S dicluster domain-containing protein [Roseibium hamelinense]TWI89558.1 4Fe-4S binding protein [Roseibium hamelinense]